MSMIDIHTFSNTLKIEGTFHSVLKSTAEFEISEDILLLILLASSQSSREGMKELISHFLLTEVSGLPSLDCVS